MRVLLILVLFLGSLSSLEAKTVLITEADHGIGLLLAQQFHDRGYKVIATAHQPGKAKELLALGIQVEQLDVADGKSVVALSKKLMGIPIDLLINNTDVLHGKGDSIEELDMDEVSHSFTINATGPLRITQKLLPNLRKGQQKQIINISSTLGSIKKNNGGLYPYRASKCALNQITKTLSIDLANEGFICVAIHPKSTEKTLEETLEGYTPEQSVRIMTGVIEKLDQSFNGRFLNVLGQDIPW